MVDASRLLNDRPFQPPPTAHIPSDRRQDDVIEAADRTLEQLPHPTLRARWLHSYALREADGRFGLACGLVAWGAWHGTLLAFERALGLGTARAPFNALRWAITFLLVVLGWVMFRAPDIAAAGRFYEAMFSFADLSLSDAYSAGIDSLQLTSLLAAYAVIAFCGWRSTASTTAPPPRTVVERYDIVGRDSTSSRSELRTCPSRSALPVSIEATLMAASAVFAQTPSFRPPSVPSARPPQRRRRVRSCSGSRRGTSCASQ